MTTRVGLLLARRIEGRSAILVQRAEAIHEREKAGECFTAAFDLDAIGEELRHLVELQRLICAAVAEQD